MSLVLSVARVHEVMGSCQPCAVVGVGGGGGGGGELLMGI